MLKTSDNQLIIVSEPQQNKFITISHYMCAVSGCCIYM